MPHSKSVLTTGEALAQACHEFAKADALAIDTEFIREKTYYPQLCLIQIADEKNAYAIDPLAPELSLEPFFALLDNPNIVKVFHAARQDLEIFYHLGHFPKNVFDTQIAAQALNFGESVSYSELMRRLVKAEIDKGSRFTDWAKRPLSAKQVIYALGDVTHLIQAYRIIVERLAEKGRTHWIDDEMTQLSDTAFYTAHPEDAWKRLKQSNMKPKQLAVLREIASWRETLAQKQDVPRGRILRDDMLVEIALAMPHSTEELSHLRGMERGGQKHAGALVEAVQKALNLPSEEWPRTTRRAGPPAELHDVIQLLQLLLQLKSSAYGIVPRLLASRDELDAFAMGARNVRFLSGWRWEAFGEEAQKLLEGNLSFSLDSETRRIRLQEIGISATDQAA